MEISPDLLNRIHALCCTFNHDTQCSFYKNSKEDLDKWTDLTKKLFAECGVEDPEQAYTALTLSVGFAKEPLLLAYNLAKFRELSAI